VFSEGLILIVDAKNTQVRFILVDDNFNSDRISMYLCVTRVKKSDQIKPIIFKTMSPKIQDLAKHGST
jgi:hypothetical protein